MILPKPFKWIKHDEPGSDPQGPYYCGVGGGGVCFGREISDTLKLYQTISKWFKNILL